MAILETLKKDMMTARKAAVAKSDHPLAEHAAFIVGLYAEVVAAAKADKPPREVPTDQDADKALRTALKRLTEAASMASGTLWADIALAQAAIVKGYLPEPLDEHHLKLAITDAAAFCDVPATMKSMGVILKRLNAEHPGKINAAEVKRLLETGAC